MELGGSVDEMLLFSPHSLHAVPRTCPCASCPVKDERAEQTTSRRERRDRRNKRTRNSCGKVLGDAQERKTELGPQRQRFVSAAGFFFFLDLRFQASVRGRVVNA